MKGLFDDLVPNRTKAADGLFDDLIPTTNQKPSASDAKRFGWDKRGVPAVGESRQPEQENAPIYTGTTPLQSDADRPQIANRLMGYGIQSQQSPTAGRNPYGASTTLAETVGRGGIYNPIATGAEAVAEGVRNASAATLEAGTDAIRSIAAPIDAVVDWYRNELADADPEQLRAEGRDEAADYAERLQAARRAGIDENAFSSAITGPLQEMADVLYQQASANRLAIQDARPENTLFGYAHDVWVSVARMGPQLAAARATGSANVGLGVMFADVYGAEFQRGLNEEGMTRNEAMTNAVVKASLEVVPEKLFGVFERFIKPGASLNRLKQAAAEGGSEAATEIANIIDDAWRNGETDVTPSEILGRVSYAFALGAGMGAVIGPGSSGGEVDMLTGKPSQDPSPPPKPMQSPAPAFGITAGQQFLNIGQETQGMAPPTVSFGIQSDQQQAGRPAEVTVDEEIRRLEAIIDQEQGAAQAFPVEQQPDAAADGPIDPAGPAAPAAPAQEQEPPSPTAAVSAEGLPTYKNDSGEVVPLNDPRLKRETYRGAMKQMVDALRVGGDITLVPRPGAKRRDNTGDLMYDYGADQMIRTPSVNPKWFQSLAEDEGVSVKFLQQTVNKALAGGRLGPRQARVIERLLDVVWQTRMTGTDQPGAEPIDFKDALRQARAMREDAKRAMRGELTDAQADALASLDPADEYAGQMLDQGEYLDELNARERALYELAEEARAADEAAAIAAIEQARDDIELAAQLYDIANGRAPADPAGVDLAELGAEQGQETEMGASTAVPEGTVDAAAATAATSPSNALPEPDKPRFTFAIKPADGGGFIIESNDGGGVVLPRRPRGSSLIDPVAPRVFPTEAAARDYIKRKGMTEDTSSQAEPDAETQAEGQVDLAGPVDQTAQIKSDADRERERKLNASPDMIEGDGELFAGPRPAQSDMFGPKEAEPVGPDFDEMVATAARWRGAATKAAEGLTGREGLRHSKMTTKGDLDAYLMKRFGIDESAARDVSNELTRRNIPDDLSADPAEFADDPWAAEGKRETAERPQNEYAWDDRDRAPDGAKVKDHTMDDFWEARTLPIEGLVLPELEGGKIAPEKRRFMGDYIRRARAGERPPRITVIEMEDGRLKVIDGHRRVLAAKEAGIETIPALVSPVPEGATETRPEPPQSDFGARWDAMSAEERTEIAKRAKWVVRSGDRLNPTGRSIIKRGWADQAEGTRAILERNAPEAQPKPQGRPETRIEQVRRENEERKRERAAIADDLKAGNGGQIEGVEAKHRRDERWAAVLPEMNETEYSHRIQYYDARGMSGHGTYNSAEEAIETLVKDGYVESDQGAMDRLSQTREWAEGTAAAEEIRKLNEAGMRSQSETPTEPIEDFGEKIAGARKDYADSLESATEKDVAAVPLSQSWPQPNYQKLIDEGADSKTVALVRALRDEVPAKPRRYLSSWVKQVESLRNFSIQLLRDPDLASEFTTRVSQALRNSDRLMGRADLYEQFGHGKSLKGIWFTKRHYSLYRGEENVTKWVVEQKARSSSFSNFPRELAVGNTREEALAKFKGVYESLGSKQRGPIKFGIWSDRSTGDIFIGRKIGKNIVRVQTGFDEVKDARKHLNDNQAELEAKLERMRDIPPHRNKTNAPRVGIDHLGGREATPEVWQETFGFRGVQFGNWVEQSRRQDDLNNAFDALMDLAGVIDVPAKALSLNGELGLAFGARGKGGKRAAAAHYEPDMVVINLTKREGAGSLAHEWWHSLDNHFGKRHGRTPFMTEAEQRSGEIRPEVVEAFNGIVRAMRESGMFKRAKKLDEVRSKDYWSTKIELSARAFEAYVIEKLADQNAANDYLANIVSEQAWEAIEGDASRYPYPTSEEMEPIRAAFDNFFQVVETKETDAGVAMYSMGDTFYSAVARAVDGIQQNKAQPQQWLAMIRNAPGVKQEELDWIGLPQWLDGQKGTIDRADIEQFVAENQVEIQEVELAPDGESEDVRIAQEQLADLADELAASPDDPEVRQRYIEASDELQSLRAQADPALGARYADWQLPGGKGYRELLLTLPNPGKALSDRERALLDKPRSELTEDEQIIARNAAAKMAPGEYRSSHFGEPNILAHVRFNERTDADGKRVLFIEEVQSDWHQAGRTQGYAGGFTEADEAALQQTRKELSDALLELDYLGYSTLPEALQAIKEDSGYAQAYDIPAETVTIADRFRDLTFKKKQSAQGVPDAPFKQSWPMLAMKRMIRYAAENGFDRIAWTTGEMQSDRYDLSKQVSGLYHWQEDGMYGISAYGPSRETILDQQFFAEKDLEGAVGKEIAERIINREGDVASDEMGGADGVMVLSGEGLKIGGEGMRAFYDRILKNEVGAYVKKFGARVGTTKIKTDNAPQDVVDSLADEPDHPLAKKQSAEVWSIDVTPLMREAAMAGQPMFARGQGGTTVEAVRAAVSPAAQRALFDSGFVTITDTPAQWPGEHPSDAAGVWMGGRVWLAASNIEQGNELGLILHEVGVHHGLESMLGKKKYDRMISRLRNQVRMGASEGAPRAARDAYEAHQRALADRTTRRKGEAAVWEETIAYMAEAGSRSSLLQEIIAAIRAFLRSIKVPLNFTAADVAHLARGSVARIVDGQSDGRVYAPTSYSFAGKRAETADRMSLQEARNRLRAGESAERIRRDTGWFRGPDNGWRFEINDKDARYLPVPNGTVGKVWTENLDRVLDHPALFAAYPQLRDLRVRSVKGMEGSAGQFRQDVGTITVSADLSPARQLSTLLHEIQHGIQFIEGFATGGSIEGERMASSMEKMQSDIAYDRFTAFQRRVLDGRTIGEIADEAERLMDDGEITAEQMQERIDAAETLVEEAIKTDPFAARDRDAAFRAPRSPQARYMALAGEVEARNVQSRQRMTDAARRRIPPEATADVKAGEVIVVMNGREMHSAPAPDNAQSGKEGPMYSRRRQPPPDWTASFNISPKDPRHGDLKTAMRKAGMPDRMSTIERAAEAAQALAWNNVKAESREFWDGNVAQGVFDRFHGLKLAEQRIAGNLPHEQSAYVAARFSTGGSSVMRGLMLHGAPEWRDGVISKKAGSRGLLEILEPVKGDLRGFFGWMIANRANRLMKENRENLFTQEEIDLLHENGEKSPLFAEFASVAKNLDEFKTAVLDLAEQAGLIDPAGRAAWDNADYIPFYRLSSEDAVRAPGRRFGIAGQSSGIRMLRGGKADLNDPMENILMNFTHLVDASMKNHAMLLAERNLRGSGVLEKVGNDFRKELIPLSQIRTALKRSGVDVSLIPRAALDGIAKLWAIKPPSDKDVVRLMRDGKAEYYRVNDPLLLRALTAIPDSGLNSTPVRVMRSFKRIFTRGVTADPGFMLRNFMRDSLHAWTINRDHFNVATDSVRGAWKTLTQTGGGIDMMFAGASFEGGFVNANDPAEAARSIRRALRQRGYKASAVNAFMATVVDSPARAWEVYTRFGDAIENANREAVYEAAIRAGKSRAQALFEAKDLMDYSMRGDFAAYQILTDVVPFLNARAQGLYKLGRAGVANPLHVAAKGSVIMIAALALLARNWDDERYRDLPDWEKDTYWHIFLPMEIEVGGAKIDHIRIPKPFEIGLIFGTMPERIAMNMLGQDNNRKTFERFLWGLRETLAFNPVPHVAMPAFEVIANTSFFTDSPIEGMADEGKLPEARANAYTSPTMKALGKFTGPSMGLSPKELEHLWNGYLGTLGTYALGVADSVVRAAGDGPARPAKRIDDYPVIKSFFRAAPLRSTKWAEMLYDMRTELNQIYTTMNAAAKAGDEAEYMRILNKRSKTLRGFTRGDALAARGMINDAAQFNTEVRRQMDMIAASETMSPEEKRAQIDELMAARNDFTKVTVQQVLEFFREKAELQEQDGPDQE